jgi:hypothetical protein
MLPGVFINLFKKELKIIKGKRKSLCIKKEPVPVLPADFYYFITGEPVPV